MRRRFGREDARRTEIWDGTERPEKEIVEAKKREPAEALNGVKKLCIEFGFATGMLNGALAEGRKRR